MHHARRPSGRIILAAAALCAAGLPVLAGSAAQAAGAPQLLFGLSGANRLVSLDAAAPSTQVSNRPVTGLAAGETLLGIDFRPRTGALFALGSTSRLYTIDTRTGAATAVGAPGAFTLSGTSFGFDFNPTVDRIRVVSNTGQNVRLHPDTGALAATDTALNYAAGDPNFGAAPSVTGAAYTGSTYPSTTTTLYDLDTALDVLVTQIPPNSGTLNTVGPLGADYTGVAGFDIARSGIAYVALNTSADGPSTVGTIDLATGAVTALGTATQFGQFTDLAAAQPTQPQGYALGADGTLRSFDGSATAPVTVGAVTGLGGTLLGIDFRPKTGQLYGLGSDSRIYVINTATAAATAIGSAGAFTLSGTSFGLDFNPTVDRIRVTSNTGQNLRLHPDTGALAATDTSLAFAAGDANSGAPAVVGSAYTNNVQGSTTTTLYDVDAARDILVTQVPPNSGTLNTVGALGIDASSVTGFDIVSGSGVAYLATTLPAASASNLYTVNLATGAASLVAPLGAGVITADIAIRPLTAAFQYPAVTSGQTASLLIGLPFAAPAGGQLVTFSSNNAAVSIVPSARIPAGVRTFVVKATTSGSGTATVTSTVNGTAVTSVLVVNP